MTDVKKILIVGGGIAGLCTAIGLRGTGITVEIVELNPKWDVYGVGIIQLANALRALAALGLAERAITEGYPMSGLQLNTPTGHVIAKIPQPQLAGPDFPAQNGIARPRLHAILQEEAQAAGAQVKLGVTVDSITQTTDQVNVTFTDGTSGQYDLVIGADGLRSKVRSLVFGNEHQPKYEGQMVWRYNLPRPEHVTDIWMFVGGPGTVGFVPLSPSTMYLFLTDASGGDAIPKIPEGQLAEEMRRRLAPFPGLIAELSQQITDSSKVIYRPFETILLPPPWHRGRVVLVGDSAHAMTAHIAQGAAMAIEDAVVLTEELQGQSSLNTVLAHYNQRRFARVAALVEMSRQICEWERTHDPNADQMGVIRKSLGVAAQPI